MYLGDNAMFDVRRTTIIPQSDLDISRMILKGSILSDTCHYWDDPFLNNT